MMVGDRVRLLTQEECSARHGIGSWDFFIEWKTKQFPPNTRYITKIRKLNEGAILTLGNDNTIHSDWIEVVEGDAIIL